MIQLLHTEGLLMQECTVYFDNTDSWTQTYTHIGFCRLKAWKNEVTFKWVSINKSAGPFNRLCPVSTRCLFHLSAGALTEGVLALLQINIGWNIWPCHWEYYGYGFRNNWISADCDLGELMDCSKGPIRIEGGPGLAMVMCGNSFRCLARKGIL